MRDGQSYVNECYVKKNSHRHCMCEENILNLKNAYINIQVCVKWMMYSDQFFSRIKHVLYVGIMKILMIVL